MPDALAAGPARRVFLVRTAAAPEALARLLSPFVLADAEIALLDYRVEAAEAAVRIEVSGLDPARAETLRRRLDGVPQIREVAVGWRTP